MRKNDFKKDLPSFLPAHAFISHVHVYCNYMVFLD